jgi:hypothetical protein
MSTTGETTEPEGWGVLRPGDRRHHYYRKSFSLCGRVGFYFGHLSPDDGTLGPEDCKACRKALDKGRGTSLPVGRLS